MILPDGLVAVLTKPVIVGERAQAFPFLTVDTDGLPHVALLSGIEIDVACDGSVLAVLAGPTTRANLLQTGTATLVAIDRTSCHTVKATLRVAHEADGSLGVVLDPVSHKDDTLGLDLTPITFMPTADLARLERWDRTAALLEVLAGGVGARPPSGSVRGESRGPAPGGVMQGQ